MFLVSVIVVSTVDESEDELPQNVSGIMIISSDEDDNVSPQDPTSTSTPL